MGMDVEDLQMGNLLDPNRTPVMISSVGSQKASHYSFLCPRLSDPPSEWNNKDMGRKIAGLLANLCLYDPLHSICFSFCLLAAWKHCLDKEVATERFAGTAFAVRRHAGQKS